MLELIHWACTAYVAFCLIRRGFNEDRMEWAR